MTLVELMVAVSVLAVGTSIAIPRITSIRDQLTLEAAAQELVHQLNLTRAQRQCLLEREDDPRVLGEVVGLDAQRA